MYIEQENNDLRITLEKLSAIWHNDKELTATDKYLTEEELIPLMESHQKNDAKPCFECVNEKLKNLIDNESIFKLMDVNNETNEDVTRHHNRKLNFDNREHSAVSDLMDDVMKTSSAQVSYCLYIHNCYISL